MSDTGWQRWPQQSPPSASPQQGPLPPVNQQQGPPQYSGASAPQAGFGAGTPSWGPRAAGTPPATGAPQPFRASGTPPAPSSAYAPAPGFGVPQTQAPNSPTPSGAGVAPGFGVPAVAGGGGAGGPMGAHPFPGTTMVTPGARGAGRGFPAWGWIAAGVAVMAVVALIATVVVPALVRVDRSGDDVDVALAAYDGELGLDQSVTLASETMFAVDRGSEWESGGVSFYDGAREAQFPYAAADCVALTTVESNRSGVKGKGDDEEATRGANASLLGDGQGAQIDIAAYGGGSVAFLAVERDVELTNGEVWSAWSAVRAFTGSGAFVGVSVLCASERDLDGAVSDFRDRVSIVVDVA